MSIYTKSIKCHLGLLDIHSFDAFNSSSKPPPFHRKKEANEDEIEESLCVQNDGQYDPFVSFKRIKMSMCNDDDTISSI